jgi:hypothetical protein
MEGTTRMRYCNKACVHLAKGTSADPVESFWLKVDKTGANGCWLYTGFRKWDGYGWLARKLNGKMRYLTAHRYAWILTHGQPADGMHIMHQCDNPPCCNPAHLKLGTHQENMADMVAKGRANGGQANKPKLWPDRVRPVKEAA